MGSCGGNCGCCSGCARELTLSEGEIEFLRRLGEVAFLPVARQLGEPTPIYPEPDGPENMSLILQVLEKKGLISLDYDKPLSGYAGYMEQFEMIYGIVQEEFGEEMAPAVMDIVMDKLMGMAA